MDNKRIEFLTRRVEECKKLLDDGYQGEIDLVEIQDSAEKELARLHVEAQAEVQDNTAHNERINKRNTGI